jgi:hypothetical protein
VLVTVHDSGNSATVAAVDGTVTTGGTLTLDAQYGNAVYFRANMDGSDGFRYDVNGDATLASGGTTFPRLSSAYRSADSLQVNGLGFPSFDAAPVDPIRRQVTFGPASVAGLLVTRKMFVPAAGGFARYLEIVSNPTTAPIMTTLAINGYYGSGLQTRVVVAPSSTGGTYSVTDAGGYCCYPALAHVFQGSGSPLVSASTTTIGSDGSLSLTYNVTINPGVTVILMHFEAQRDTRDTTGADSEAQALVNLTDANALAGMSNAEKGAVVNFVIPTLTGANLAGNAPFAGAASIELVDSGKAVIEVCADEERRVWWRGIGRRGGTVRHMETIA